jgi:hypothetical protein
MLRSRLPNIGGVGFDTIATHDGRAVAPVFEVVVLARGVGARRVVAAADVD